MISIEQCRAARALLGWSQGFAAERLNIGRRTLAEFESGARTPQSRTLRDIKAGFEAHGIAFLTDEAGGVGVFLDNGSDNRDR
jgi:transcriptional regulator with XRE-family HTH domain